MRPLCDTVETPGEYVCSIPVRTRQENPSRESVLIGRGGTPQAAQYLAAGESNILRGTRYPWISRRKEQGITFPTGEAIKYIIGGQHPEHVRTDVMDQIPEYQVRLETGYYAQDSADI